MSRKSFAADIFALGLATMLARSGPWQSGYNQLAVLKMCSAQLRSSAKLTNFIGAQTSPNQPIYLIGPVAQPLPLLAT